MPNAEQFLVLRLGCVNVSSELVWPSGKVLSWPPSGRVKFWMHFRSSFSSAAALWLSPHSTAHLNAESTWWYIRCVSHTLFATPLYILPLPNFLGIQSSTSLDWLTDWLFIIKTQSTTKVISEWSENHCIAQVKLLVLSPFMSHVT